MPHFGEIRSLADLIDVLLTALADGDVLTYDAALEQWINQALPPGATKEFWVPTTIGLATATQAKLGDHGGYDVDGSSEEAITEFHVPHDFNAIDEAVLVVIPGVTLTPMDLLIRIDIAANGELYNIRSGTGPASIATTAQRILEIDIAPALALINAGDYVGVRFICDLGVNTDALVLGVRLKYT